MIMSSVSSCPGENYFFTGNVQNILYAIREVTPTMCIAGGAVLAEALYRVGHCGSDLFLPNDVDIFIPAWTGSRQFWKIDDLNAYLEQTFSFLFTKGFEVKDVRRKFQQREDDEEEHGMPTYGKACIFSIIEFQVKIHQPQPAVPIDKDVTYQLIFVKDFPKVNQTFAESVVSRFDFNVVRGVYNVQNQRIYFPTEDAYNISISDFLQEKVFLSYIETSNKNSLRLRKPKYEQRGFTFGGFVMYGVWFYVPAYRRLAPSRRRGGRARR